MEKIIKVIVADNHPLVCHGIKTVFEDSDDIVHVLSKSRSQKNRSSLCCSKAKTGEITRTKLTIMPAKIL